MHISRTRGLLRVAVGDPAAKCAGDSLGFLSISMIGPELRSHLRLQDLLDLVNHADHSDRIQTALAEMHDGLAPHWAEQ